LKKTISLAALVLALCMLVGCVTQAPEPVEPTTLKDGTYTAQAQGYSLYDPVSVTVEIKEGKISAIKIGENKETNGMPQAVEANMIPRIIENQSLAVDMVTGVTYTSSAVRLAVEKCCEQAGGDVSKLQGEITKDTAAKEFTVDVAVVGMGGSGTAAALAAAESGAKVMCIDKAGKWGGTSAVAGGAMGVNMPSQVAAEIPNWVDAATGETKTKKAGEMLADADALYDAWTEYTTVNGVQDAKPEIIRLTIDESGKTLDWLTTYGFEFTPAVGFIGNKYAIYATYVGNKANTENYFAAAYEKFVDELGGQLMLNTAGTELVIENGKVAGVKAVTADGAPVTIHADSVILATGGFPGNAEMKKQYIGGDWSVYGMMQNTGAGIQMALSAGAATRNIETPPMAHFVGPSVITREFSHEDNDIPYGMVSTGESLAVNTKGARTLSEARLALEGYTVGARYYTIYSKEQIDILREQGLSLDAGGRYLTQGGIKANTPLTNIDAVLQSGIERKFIYKAESLDKLAAAIGGEMNAATLKASVADYAKYAAGTADPLGKKADLFKRLGAPAPESEYYIAVTGAPYIYMTCGGVDVNADMQVLKEDGSVIEGLYAVGADSMGVLFTDKKGYVNYGGVSMGYVFTSGYVAGKAAAGK